MEAHVVIAVGRVDEAGENVLAAVLLHETEPPRPVDAAFHHGAHLQGTITEVDDFTARFVGVRDGHAAQHSLVAGLAAALGIEGRPVQRHVPAVLSRPAAGHRGRKYLQMRILIIEPFHCHCICSFS